MSSRREKDRRRDERLARERAERERHQRMQLRLLLGGAIALAFAIVLGASLLVAGGSDDDGGSSNVAVPSSVQARGTGPEEGKLFPEFLVTDADDRKLTRASLKGKPSVVWFTTSYCVPCQVGAREVSQLDDELGGDKFDVLVVFVDPNEPTSALESWKESFANGDWLVALDKDNTLANVVRLRQLDTKFLLNQAGVIQNVDLDIADNDYLDLIREHVGAAG